MRWRALLLALSDDVYDESTAAGGALAAAVDFSAGARLLGACLLGARLLGARLLGARLLGARCCVGCAHAAAAAAATAAADAASASGASMSMAAACDACDGCECAARRVERPTKWAVGVILCTCPVANTRFVDAVQLTTIIADNKA